MELPTTIGRYRVRAVLGSGGFATVFHAVDDGLDADVAIKVLAENWAYDPEIRERFISEARIMRSIQSDAVSPVFDIGELSGRPYFVMPMADRGTLADRLTVDGSVGLADVRRVVQALADSLTVLHDVGVVHRDVKPANLLIRSARSRAGASSSHEPGALIRADERVLLSDFGLAKDLMAASGLTINGGTPGYVAPEQLAPGGVVDERADIYAATAIVCRLWTGSVPVSEGSDRLSPAQRQLLAGGAATIDRGLRVDPAARPADIEAWREEMTWALDRHASASVAMPHPERTVPTELANADPTLEPAGPSRRRVIVGAGAVAAVAVGGTLLGVLDVFGGSSPSAIVGPRRVPVGSTGVYTAFAELLLEPGEDVASIAWIDAGGDRVDEDTFFIRPSSTGRVSFEVELVSSAGDEARTDVVVDAIEAGGAGPVVGPEEIPVGGVGIFTVDPTVAGSGVPTWAAGDGPTTTAETYFVRPTSAGTITLSVETDTLPAVDFVVRAVDV